MGTMSFLLPASLSPDEARELERACVAAGPEGMPWPTRARVECQRLIVERLVEESGYLVAPWKIDGAGQLMGSSGTLMERPLPYHFLQELARGKLAQLRSQADQWQQQGLVLPANVEALIHRARRAFCRAATEASTAGIDQDAQVALNLAYQAAEQLVHCYVQQVLALRRQNPEPRQTAWGCRLRAA